MSPVRFNKRRIRNIIIFCAATIFVFYLISSSGLFEELDARINGTYVKIFPKLSKSSHLEGNLVCRRVKLELNDTFISTFFHKSDPIICKSESDWICVKNGVADICDVRKRDDVSCSFKYLSRKDDFDTTEGNEVVGDGRAITLKNDFFTSHCKTPSGQTFDSVRAAIRFDPEVHKRSGFEHVPKDGLGLNVLIWGHDSLSRLTFMRKLPTAYQYLTEKLGAVVLQGYNIVGDGTPQALIPILTGKTELELPDTRQRMRSKAQFVDVYPFVWNDFRDNGYVTYYAEDCPSIGTFTYRLKGFDSPPTDHYMRPFFVYAENEYKKHSKYCLNDKPRHKIMMDYMKDFVTMYRKKPKFAFSFHSELSHDDHNRIGAIDDDLTQFLKFLNDEGHLDNTLFIVMSDHGHRFAKIRETIQGKEEERLPFFSLVLPPWFEQKYPHAMKNLRTNAGRLTTPFDIYPTLRDVLKFEGTGLGDVTHRGISLFKEVPLWRSCEDADVEAHWCTCLDWQQVKLNDEIAVKAMEAVVEHINDLTSDFRQSCSLLRLEKIIWVEKLVPNEELLKFKKTKDPDGFIADRGEIMNVDLELYQVKIHTGPGEGHFEATVKYNKKDEKFAIRSDDISRVNKYGNAAACIEKTQEHLRKFCYCIS